ncbi:MAG TPA: oligosaccharide flippase family protein, partial [Bacteroidota bacterium]|nr:oligosaccharide flippase family protein [Bacteroidota bacterium]
YVLGERVLNYLNRNLDYIIIGRFFGAEALGYYSLAYQVILVPISKVSQVIGRVAFPTFSQVQDSNAKIRFGYTKMVEFISLVSFPLMGILFLLAPEFIRAVYGMRWEPAIVLLRIFCILGAIECIGTTVGGILYAKNHADIAFRYNIINVIGTGAAIFVGMQAAGVVGVAAAIAALSFPLAYMWHSKTNALLELSWGDFLRPMKFAALGTLVVIILALLTKNALSIDDNMTTILLVGGIATLFYSALLLVFNRELLIEARQMVKSAFET